MTKNTELLCAWSGPLTMILFGIGWVPCAGWLPPPPPSLSAIDVASIYQHNTIGIRTGMLLMMYAGGLNAAFAAIVTVYMKRLKGPSPALAYIQLVSGVCNVVFFIVPAQIFTAVAFRPDRAPDITQFGNDLGWMFLDMVNSPAIIQFLVVGVAILSDESDRPLFPRWSGYFSLWASVMMVPACLITYFKAGPFSWAGILGFYLGVVTFGTWYFVIAGIVARAIRAYHQGRTAMPQVT